MNDVTHPNPRRATLQALTAWKAAGLSHLPKPPERADEPPPPDESNEEPEAEPVTTPTAPGNRHDMLTDLAKQVAACTRCEELASTRTQTVFGVGNPEAQVMFIGEAPGADEDKQGEPFVGKAGQLLTRIIEACGWKREDLYICNILRCRPPENRNPTTEEAANCREYLDGQIAIVDPDYIVCWGTIAAQNLLDTNQTIGRMRQRWYEYGRAKVLCTYHPSYLLRNPAAKKPVWDDILFLLDEMGVEPPRR
ncbi:MAG: uracil-DNA glycosylase [Planctomycetota bacterium]|nr:MAG: uracil-DNA glycosylase [Planctomycetota bacterium]REJ88515.1 MAG: uracil-DNA glycosylase [Planctomycetota bacterium]REK22427.1 MAG: uracil-DNA glycosylase [Planctomycetota bacterium]REK34923.1 MAG: uracil-DNA glycosylase [Planctomycetota bacterium]